MNVFELRDSLVQDYGSFVRGFINIQDEHVAGLVEDELRKGLLWPDPLIQLSPSFKAGEAIDQLVDESILHSECSRIFRIKGHKDDPGQPLRLHLHQSEAIRAARLDNSYVLTTGTGSGKSLSYIVPIVDHTLRSGPGNHRIKAIVVYPMNALANSQEGELQKFLTFGYPESKAPVTFRRYTGQESDEEKNEIRQNPPDILLTNYVMLELILTRPDERPLVEAARDLRFLVLDELHTYRGRQGADVAMLVRRTREATRATNMRCVGTSATLAGGGAWKDQQKEVAKTASLLLGTEIHAENVIGETLERVTREVDFDSAENVTQLGKRISLKPLTAPGNYQEFCEDILASWIESTFGIQSEAQSGRLVRQKPQSISGPGGAAAALSQLTGVDKAECAHIIETMLLAGYQCGNPETQRPVFAFRLNQFISRGDTVYASVNPERDRFVTLQKQHFVPGEGRERVLLPLVFCRRCGQEFYCVQRVQDSESGGWWYEARDLTERLTDDDSEAGFLYVSQSDPWPTDASQLPDRVPDDWQDDTGRVVPARRKNLPENIRITPLGIESPEGLPAAFIQTPFRFCPKCQVSYAGNQRSDFGKLSAIGTEGRSTATTVLSLAAIKHIRGMDLPPEAKKLLSFTDNRQDASLQAGHFNDFIGVGLLRAALYQALANANNNRITHEELTQRVFDAMNLPFEAYASNPEAQFQAKRETERALREVLGYRLYRDLQRGWRVTAPNLEQTGLLEFDYSSLTELCQTTEVWANHHDAWSAATPEIREQIAQVLLDYMRRELVVKADYLDPIAQERLLRQSQQRLLPPWGFDESEQPRDLVHAGILFPRARRGSDRWNLYLSPRGLFGQFLRRNGTFPDYHGKLTLDDTAQIIQEVISALLIGGLIERVQEGNEEDVPGYQLVASSMIWCIGDGAHGYRDVLRQPTESSHGEPVNAFFREYYRTTAGLTFGLHAREHTAQVPYDEREKREADFRKASLPVLYCSPTMELGIDIAQLNMVNMRNVPPTPANYAQRSGRAGRSGQPALIFTYCSAGSPHDQYFFKRPARMVAGQVSPPQIDLANEDLLRAHVDAIWLSEARLKLGTTLTEILDVNGEAPSLDLLPSVQQALGDTGIRDRAKRRARDVIGTIREQIMDAPWYAEAWLDEVMAQLPPRFEQAADRWRGLYRSALYQQQTQNQIILDQTRPVQDRDQAKRLRREAEAQLELLTTSRGALQSDFYSYRYFAGEGFLPGYNFPRLPLSAFIPGRRIRGGKDEYLSRPRFLAITEFGPRAFVYHEGSRYVIHQVILPARNSPQDVVQASAKICVLCGYLHPIREGYGPDICEHCGSELPPALPNLFRLQNVVAKRRDQINCDEEERLRYGFDVTTTVRFATRGGRLSCRHAEAIRSEENLLSLSYGDAATLWRINRGYRRRSGNQPDGFVLDLERGYWARSNQEDNDDSDPMSVQTIRVMPYVRDSKNCLIIKPQRSLDMGQMASLQSALKNAIQTTFELEDNELATEPLPSRDDRRMIMIYESAEGGAGVLRQLLSTTKFRNVIEMALEICHFDPQSGQDLRRAPLAQEDCEAACYDCLMSYGNQMDHRLLDRKSIVGFLLELLQADVQASSSDLPRGEQLRRLKASAGSNLEKRWLDLLDRGNYVLPTHGQRLFEACGTRPDFIYEKHCVAVYIDGPPHDHPERQHRDHQQTECMENLGWTVLHFHHTDDWQSILDNHPGIFGDGR